jgi:hypothetical protein
MVRTLDLIMVTALVAGAGWTFKVKHDAEQAVARVEHLETQIRIEREAIEVLKADWGLLTNPARLEALAKRYGDDLKLQPLQPRQIVTPNAIPHKMPEGVTVDDSEQAGLAADTNTKTGSIPAKDETSKLEVIE